MSIGLGIGNSISGKVSGFGGGGGAPRFGSIALLATDARTGRVISCDSLNGTEATATRRLGCKLASDPVSPKSFAAAVFNLKNPSTYQMIGTTARHTLGGCSDGTTQYGDCNVIPSTGTASANDACACRV
jgi:hypothetical protein